MPLLMVLLAAAAVVIPLDRTQAWEVLRYSGIRPHAVRFGDFGMRIDVNSSAAPLIHALDAPRRVRRLEVTGRIDGSLQTTSAEQGRQGHDDYTLRVGLVEVGTKRPGWFERQFAPAWVKRLFELAPPDLGIAGIRFYNLGLAASQVGDSRQHPASDLIQELIVGVPEPDGTFTMAVDLDRPVETAAIWISSDGDDTRSRFIVTLEQFTLVAEGPDAVTSAVPGPATAPRGRQ
jgi:hypothetical protein